VPLILKLPGGANADTVITAQVRTLDIMPTLLEFAGAPAAQHRDGESLEPYFVGKTQALSPAYGETDYPLRFGWSPLRSVRSEGFKFIEAPRPELYDLPLDPAEMTNKYEPQNVHVQKSRAMLADVRIKEAQVQGSATATTQPSSLPDPKDKIEEQNLLHTAMIASEDNRLTDARKTLEKALTLDPKSPTALRQLGELELQAGDYVQAANHLKRAVEVRPDDATALFHEGQALEKTHDLGGARDALEASLKHVPAQYDARLLLGHVYLGLQDPTAAEDQFEAALLLQPDSVEPQLCLAQAQINKGDFKNAAQSLGALSKSHPKNAQVFDLLAKAYSGLGKKTEAQQAATRAKLLGSNK
jgi:predicted Zn-dependent protease